MRHIILFALLAAAPVTPVQYGARRLVSSQVTPGAVPPDLPAVDPDPAFPLRFHIVTDRWGGIGYRNHGYGSANLIDPAKGDQPQGFNFAFECDQPFAQNNNPAESYQARWKKAPYELEILTVDLATRKPRTCKLRLAPEVRPFDHANTVRYTHGVSSSLRVRWADPDFAYEKPDPAFPIQFHVFEGQRRESAVDDQGWGSANLVDPAKPNSFQVADYEYDCNYGFLNNSQTLNYYQGRWVKPNQKLELLLQRPGTDKVDHCTITVNLHPAPPSPAPPPAPQTP